MDASTVVRRTEAGSAELAVPAHGLSLVQRRFLTLLDTPRTLDELTLRQPADAERLERDLGRLAQLGLVAWDAPSPANDAIASPSPANDPVVSPTPAVRLGTPGLSRKLPFVLAPLVAALIAWAGWQQWHAPSAPSPGAQTGVTATTSAPAPAAPPSDPTPIATRVLRSDVGERAHDPGRDARAASRNADARAESATPKPPALPVEHRSPATATLRAEAADGQAALPTERLRPIVTDSGGTSAEAAAAMAKPVGPSPVTPGATDAAAGASPATPAPTAAAARPVTPAAPPVAASTAPPPARAPVDAPVRDAPVQVAVAAPAAHPSRPAPPPALVPLVREAPAFPREAIALGLANGDVKARLSIDAKGNVSDVVVIEATHRAFNRAVRDALARWRFEPGSPGRSTVVDVAFKRD